MKLATSEQAFRTKGPLFWNRPVATPLANIICVYCWVLEDEYHLYHIAYQIYQGQGHGGLSRIDIKHDGCQIGSKIEEIGHAI